MYFPRGLFAFVIVMLMASSCAHKSGQYKMVNGKWKFVPNKVGFLQRVSHPRLDTGHVSIKEKGMFRWPVPATKKISSHFGPRRGRHHDGIDIPSSNGSHILASASGKVIFSGWMRGYGKIIVLKHKNNFNTVYAHNSKNFVKKGETVIQGQVIGKIGNTGRSSGPHLHFEIRRSNKVINPMKFFTVHRKLASKR